MAGKPRTPGSVEGIDIQQAPASDPNRATSPRRKSDKNPAGQPGHRGSTSQPYDDPDYIELLTIDRRSLSKAEYRDAGFEMRQVVDIDISGIVTEYRAQVRSSISISTRRQVSSNPGPLALLGAIESPPPDERQRLPAKRGRLKRSKSRRLPERLRQFEHDVLRFMSVAEVPFTNHQGENDIRMTRVQQKIPGCLRSMEGAKTFCRIRGYLSTCRKHRVSASETLSMLYEGRLPNFFGSGAE